jgi:hypothetical protein
MEFAEVQKYAAVPLLRSLPEELKRNVPGFRR